MLRRFRQHDHRTIFDLGGVWDFAFLGDLDPDQVDPHKIRYDDRMAVPGCFDATPAYAGRRGLTAYHTKVFLADATPHELVIDGLHHWGRVFLGGKQIGEHVGGFTRFGLDVRGLQPGTTDLVILVDNRMDYDRCPLHLDYFDWYHFGGITRGVELHRLGNTWIDAVRVVTEDYRTRRIAIEIDWASVAEPDRLEVTVTCAGQTLRQTVEPDDGVGRIELKMDLPGAALWSPEGPNLHEIHVQLGQDDWRERIGIRQVECRDRQILINGQSLRLLGFNRHEAHPQFGHAVPEQIMVADLQQLRDMGCNFVRGSHYPQDVRFLDLCDEMGICVWEESIGWQHKIPHLTDERFLKAQETNIDEMIAAGCNRPSVILWGILNESQSDKPECRPGYERLLKHIRTLDPTRPVTYATCCPMVDLCYDLIDVIAINTYPGWYKDSIEGIPEALDKLAAHVDGTGHAHKPFIISEIGGAAVYGCRDWNADRWTEQYQARILDTVIRHLFVNRDRACGLAIWQFCDGRTMPTMPQPMMTRARGFNNKGVVDEYRRPKLAYDVVKRWFHQLSGNVSDNKG
jgi:beta-glucuronidase